MTELKRESSTPFYDYKIKQSKNFLLFNYNSHFYVIIIQNYYREKEDEK